MQKGLQRVYVEIDREVATNLRVMAAQQNRRIRLIAQEALRRGLESLRAEEGASNETVTEAA